MKSASNNLQIGSNRLHSGLIGLLTMLTVMLLLSGCQIAPKDKPFSWPWKKDSVKPLPDRILTVWTDSVLHQPNQAGVRGFGGRVYFYTKDNTDPIEVDGSLAVYVFDADEIDVSAQKPLRKFMFTADQFGSHMSKTSIGPSYSVWLPWGEIGGPPRRLSLITRFEGKEGGTTISDPIIKLLPGVPVKNANDDSDSDATPFRLSGHQKKFDVRNKNVDQADSADETDPAANSDVKTIDLPPSFQRHLRGGVPDANSATDAKSAEPIRASTPADQSRAADQSSNAVSDGNLSLLANTTASSEPEQAASSPVTTQVFDYRTRRKNGATTFNSNTGDIRQGRWIESIARD